MNQRNNETMKQQSMRVVILAAGKGTRMKSEEPKALLPFLGRPMIFSLLDAVRASGVDPRPIIVVGHGAEKIRSVVGDGYDYVIQEEQRGTGHAVLVTKSVLKGKADAVLVLYVDHPRINPGTIRRLAETHEQEKAMLTMITAVVPHFNQPYEAFSQFGRIVRDASGAVQKVIEVSEATKEELAIREVNTALYCFNAEWLWGNISLLQPDNAKQELFLTDLIHLAVQEKAKIVAIVETQVHGLVGVNTQEQLREAELWMKTSSHPSSQ